MASSDCAVRKPSQDALPGLQQYPWESRFQWLCRRRFAEAHKDRYGLEKAISLSMVWANINFLGCEYSSKTTSLVSHYPVPESDDMNRWVSVHGNIVGEQRTDSQTRKRKLSPPSGSPPAKVAREEATGQLSNPSVAKSENEESGDSVSFETLTQHLDALISTYRKQKEQDSGSPACASVMPSSRSKPTTAENQNAKRWLDLLARNTCLCDQCEPQGSHPVTTVVKITQKVQSSAKFSFYELPDGSHTTELFVDDVLMAQGTDSVKKVSKMKAAQALMADIAAHQDLLGKPPCPIANRKVAHASLEALSGQHAADKIPEDSKGSQMLRRMGWSGEGGLGHQGEGRSEPVASFLEGQGSRAGLGGRGTSLSSSAIRDQLLSFIRSDDNELVFSPDLTPADREAIHNISQQYHLSHKSYGMGSARHLVVRKKEPIRGVGSDPP